MRALPHPGFELRQDRSGAFRFRRKVRAVRHFSALLCRGALQNG